MSGVRSVKVAEGMRHEYVTQNGKVVRDNVTDAATGAFQYMLDFTYDESGHPLTMRRYFNEAQSNYCTYHYILNAQGDVVKLMYGTNKAVAEYSYDAWGNVLSVSGADLSVAKLNPLRYRGYYCDSETGFYYLESRYYDPIVRRFLNADSYSSTGQGILGYNMFAYCNNNPIGSYDPSGHMMVCADKNLWSGGTTIKTIIDRLEAGAKAVMKTIEEENRKRRQRFEESFERSYGKPFSSVATSTHYSVTVETHYPAAMDGIKLTADACSVAGIVFLKIPEPVISKVGGTVCTVVGGGCTIAGWFGSPDEEYSMYVVDIWDVKEWVPLSNGKTIGIAVGQKYQFRISNDGEFVKYVGTVNFAEPNPGIPSSYEPCYNYYFRVDENWCRIP